MGGSFGSIAIVAGAIVIALVAIGVIVSMLYKRATQDIAYVRTGLGGPKVIVQGGSIVLPIFHDTMPVSMKTIKLEVSRGEKEALITKDSIRADVRCEFFVRVKKEHESIMVAAQTLGALTSEPVELKKLIEGKLIDALRAAAATMELAQIHENRPDFVQKVQQAVNVDLEKNGLELESVSLVALDQTDPKYLNPNNTFDSAALKKITVINEANRKEVFDTEQTTAVMIAERARETTMKKLDLERDTENAKISQEQQIANARAEAEAVIAKRQSEARMTSEQARIEAEQQIAERDIASKLAVELATQQRETKVANESMKKSAAEAEASEAKAKAVSAEEKITTARAVEVADRGKQVELVEARKTAEKAAIGITVAAQAEKDSAVTRAEAIRTVAEAEAGAEMIRADAKAKTYEVESEGTRKVNEAQNVISDRIVEMNIRMRVIEMLPGVLAAATAPLENIESIKIVDVSGLNGVATGGTGGGNAEGGSLADQLVKASLKNRAMAPMLDDLMKSAGLGGSGSLGDLTSPLREAINGPAVTVDGANAEVIETTKSA